MKDEECEDNCRNVIYEHLLRTRRYVRESKKMEKKSKTNERRRKEVLSEIFIILHVIASVVLIDHQQVEMVESLGSEGILPRNYLSLANNHSKSYC